MLSQLFMSLDRAKILLKRTDTTVSSSASGLFIDTICPRKLCSIRRSDNLHDNAGGFDVLYVKALLRIFKTVKQNEPHECLKHWSNQ
jgi:hypothetical protein